MREFLFNMFKIVDRCLYAHNLRRNISICKTLFEENKKPKKKVTETVELVTLVDQNDKILGLKPKAESEKLAKKLSFTLERVTDTKYGKVYPAYKMISPADLLTDEKKSTTAKVLKKLPLNSRISDHDLTVKLQTVRKWMSKNCEVHITILANNEPKSAMNSLLKKLESQLKEEFRIIDVREKEGAIKFIIIPPKQPKSTPKEKKQDLKSEEGNS